MYVQVFTFVLSKVKALPMGKLRPCPCLDSLVLAMFTL